MPQAGLESTSAHTGISCASVPRVGHWMRGEARGVGEAGCWHRPKCRRPLISSASVGGAWVLGVFADGGGGSWSCLAASPPCPPGPLEGVSRKPGCAPWQPSPRQRRATPPLRTLHRPGLAEAAFVIWASAAWPDCMRTAKWWLLEPFPAGGESSVERIPAVRRGPGQCQLHAVPVRAAKAPPLSACPRSSLCKPLEP